MTIVWPDGGPSPQSVTRDMGSGLRPGQPVVALDFDGVLNITTTHRDREPPRGFQRRMIELDREHWPTHPYIRPLPFGRNPVTHAIVTSSEHLELVSDWLAAGAAVIWATTWELAIREPAREIGLPDLPVLLMSSVEMADYPQRTALWKLAALEASFPGRPVAWVDDFAGDWEEATELGDPPAPFLAVAPNEFVGLTSEQAAEVTRFVRANS